MPAHYQSAGVYAILFPSTAPALGAAFVAVCIWSESGEHAKFPQVWAQLCRSHSNSLRSFPLLTHISVRDLAIVESLSVELESGLTVMTGETGAGKSILIDALSLALGARSNAGLVRTGAQRAEITALFNIAALPVTRAALAKLELDGSEDELHLRRTIATDGRSRAYINGRPVPAQLLRELAATLVDIHGQHEHQSLLAVETQRDLLDAFGEHQAHATSVRHTHHEWRKLKDEHAALASGQSDHRAHLSLLRYQLDELDTLAPNVDEYAKLMREHKRLAGAEDVREQCYAALAFLRDNEAANVQALLGRANQALVNAADAEFQPVLDLLETATIHAVEAAHAVDRLAQDRQADPRQLQQVEQRLEHFQDVARKHHVAPEALAQLLIRLRTELQQAEALTLRATQIDGALEQALAIYTKKASRLSSARRSAAKKMGAAISASMQELGMAGGRCEVVLHTLDSSNEGGIASEPRTTGAERVEIQVAANPGSPLRSLSRAASGGELSRISLAIQVQLAQGSGVPSLVFDEVDVGIGGGVAEIVGRQLRHVAGKRQVLCITHLAQVACQGEQHLRVIKRATGNTTHTSLERLHTEERVKEIARMLGGRDITKRTLEHAQEMLQLAHSEA
jgi:DNA repair protein RecN (Recombination protein N)